jgi:hypothetical protein
MKRMAGVENARQARGLETDVLKRERPSRAARRGDRGRDPASLLDTASLSPAMWLRIPIHLLRAPG